MRRRMRSSLQSNFENRFKEHDTSTIVGTALHHRFIALLAIVLLFQRALYIRRRRQSRCERRLASWLNHLNLSDTIEVQ
ncbi:hypothetical protein TNCV_1212341 [Trichonephila clavipes]|nr:hypothetical protein TNCV_1212341 [Trichonephila clavipes]